MILSLCIVSCGKKDTFESLSDEMISQMNELTIAIESAKDKESAEKAVARIDEIADEIKSIAERMEALGEPSEDEVKAVKEKWEAAEKENNEKMTAAMKTLISNREVAEILGKGMMEFGKKLESTEETFKKIGIK